MVAAVCTWHEHHERAAREIVGRLQSNYELVVAAAGLVEAYSVLTRLPAPYRLSPSDAHALLSANYMGGNTSIVSLSVDEYVHLVNGAPGRNISSGTIYDAVILATARSAGAEILLTFNDRHFLTLSVPEVEIVVPS